MTNELTQSQHSLANDQTNQTSSPLPSAWIEKLFSEMSGMYGKLFADQWGGVDPKITQQVWAKHLAGFTGQELKTGLDACLKRKFPPTLPEFISLCRPPVDYESAFYEAVNQMQRRRDGHAERWSKPAIYWAATKIGNDLFASPYNAIKARWVSALDDAIGNSPKTIPAKAQALPSPEKLAVSPEEAHKRITELAEMLKNGSPTPSR